MSDEDLLKILSDFRKPEKLAKLTVIPGWLSISIQPSTEPIPSENVTYFHEQPNPSKVFIEDVYYLLLRHPVRENHCDVYSFFPKIT